MNLKKNKKDKHSEPTCAIDFASAEDTSGDIAAIAAALYEIGEINHIEESGILTIKRVSQEYSPWNSKGQMILHQPFRRQ